MECRVVVFQTQNAIKSRHHDIGQKITVICHSLVVLYIFFCMLYTFAIFFFFFWGARAVSKKTHKNFQVPSLFLVFFGRNPWAIWARWASHRVRIVLELSKLSLLSFLYLLGAGGMLRWVWSIIIIIIWKTSVSDPCRNFCWPRWASKRLVLCMFQAFQPLYLVVWDGAILVKVSNVHQVYGITTNKPSNHPNFPPSIWLLCVWRRLPNNNNNSNQSPFLKHIPNRGVWAQPSCWLLVKSSLANQLRGFGAAFSLPHDNLARWLYRL